MMTVLDGKKVSAYRREILRGKVRGLVQGRGITPGLAVVLVGDDPASQVYVANKAKTCEALGMKSWVHRRPANVAVSELKSLIQELNADKAVHGILVQLPLPKGFNEDEVLSWIDPGKDVDALTVHSQGLLFAGRPQVLPCTPSGVMALLEYYQIPVSGKKAVVVGRSQIVGKPMALLLLQANATVTICHSKTTDLSAYTREADIVVVAAGRPHLLGREDFKKGAVVVDVGIHRDGGGLRGDVRFDELEGWVSAATPVPGGVGPMTIAMLLENTFNLATAKGNATIS